MLLNYSTSIPLVSNNFREDHSPMKPDEQHQHPEHKVKYFYFLDGQKLESETSSVSGATVRAKLPTDKAGYAIYLESHGQDPDKLVQDTDNFSLEKGALKFYSVPPATFGKA